MTFKKELTDEERAEGKEEPTPMPFKLSDKHKKLLNEYLGKKVVLGIRPEHIRIKKTGQKSDPIKVTCEYCEVLGSEAFSYTFIAGQRICFKTFDKVRFKRGEEVDIYLDDSSLYFFDAESGKRIR
ncbi:MAG: TOBE domain-containing protein [Bacilli bacterium]|nr:TOBE domain-containing protein [Bacilli bacterium]